MSAAADEPGVDGRFLDAVDALPAGYAEGTYDGRRWGVTLDTSPDRRRRWLYGEALDGSDHVSFNLYRLDAGPALRPCEMPVAKVVGFVLGYTPDAAVRG